ncbi:putative lantibiotic dehydratase [Streptomyces sp. EAS-AB2608]|uniref:lantibiotic dehydratase n=1 Tax=Streptomyces sp. EAS-AB2608 TaxID=2779671 RepID=UPI001BF0CE51|nr:lantibiotic dehydratase [Streptomyces sp. EAS-AB2608]BCM65681.1 putative lantibiotic dehydratase [Streptomyces sp. EAS-AB2608]
MYHAVDAGMIRTSAFPLSATLPPWPDLDGGSATDVSLWKEWITQVWADDTRAAAVEVASPLLADSIRQALDDERTRPRAIRRTVISLARYLLRMQYRATPSGLLAGPAPLRIGPTAQAIWGTAHRAFARADSQWLHDVVATLERDPQVLRYLPVVVNPTCTVRGGRVTVLHQPGADGPTDTRMRRTPAIEAVLTLARSEITVGDLADKLSSEYPDTDIAVIENMLRDLVAHRVLLSTLHAPMTCENALGHLIDRLEVADVASAPTRELRQISTLLAWHDTAPVEEQRSLRGRTTAKMIALTAIADRTLAVYLRPDCDIVLPEAVTCEAEKALEVMARVTPFPSGSPAWKDYRTRFLERYSMGAIVPLRDLIDPDTGLGYPVSYRGTLLKRPVLATTWRDEHLLALAQNAALNDQREVVLTPEDIAALSLGEPDQVPAHVELCFSVLSPSLEDLNRGDFVLSTVGLATGAGTTTGRFLSMLERPDRERMIAAYAGLPTLTVGAERGQVSSPPLRVQTYNVGRAPAIVPNVLAVGEHNLDASLKVDDLGVVADSQRLYLVSLSTGEPIEPSVMNAVELSNATHPLARFVCELHRSHTAVLVPFSWGAAAQLPFLPEVRIGRTILSSACWRLRTRDLNGGGLWSWRFTNWRVRYGVPRTVYLGADDRRLRLDLDVPAHVQLLRADLERYGMIVLHEAPPEEAFGWVGRAHEVTIPFAAEQAAASPPAFRPEAVVNRDLGRLPGGSRWAYLKLYGNPDRADEVLTPHLPRLLLEFGAEAPDVWFSRYADPDSHLRVRLRLSSPEAFGEAVQKTAVWADELRREGLIQRVQWDTDTPEIGRYGTGPVLEAAERYFTADSAAVVAQLVLPIPGHCKPAVTAASMVDIATVFLGSPQAGRAWLTMNFRNSEGAASSRDAQALAILLTGADVGERAAALRQLPRGQHVAGTWALRRRLLDEYRQALQTADIDPATVLPSLLHMHHNRAAGIDPDAEATCRRLARTAALSWTARAEGAPR